MEQWWRFGKVGEQHMSTWWSRRQCSWWRKAFHYSQSHQSCRLAQKKLFSSSIERSDSRKWHFLPLTGKASEGWICNYNARQKYVCGLVQGNFQVGRFRLTSLVVVINCLSVALSMVTIIWILFFRCFLSLFSLFVISKSPLQEIKVEG